MAERYEHEIVDSNGKTHPFSLTVEKKGVSGQLSWPPETSTLEAVKRLTKSSITALIVWPTMKVRCWINAGLSEGGSDLEIVFAITPYRYRIEDGGTFVDFIANLAVPGTGIDEQRLTEQPAPPGNISTSNVDGTVDSGNCGSLVYVEDRSDNQEYAYYFLVNASDKDAGVTIRNTWLYEGRVRTETKRHNLYPKEEREVFPFPRRQNPTCTIISCGLG